MSTSVSTAHVRLFPGDSLGHLTLRALQASHDLWPPCRNAGCGGDEVEPNAAGGDAEAAGGGWPGGVDAAEGCAACFRVGIDVGCGAELSGETISVVHEGGRQDIGR